MTHSISILAHFDGQHALVLDEPVDLPVGKPLRVYVETVEEEAATQQLENAVAAVEWEPLNLPINPELSRAIAEEPEFNIEES